MQRITLTDFILDENELDDVQFEEKSDENTNSKQLKAFGYGNKKKI